MSKAKKVVKAKATGPQYFRAVDLLLAAVEYTRKGMPNRAAKALAEAAQDEQIDDALNQLDAQQQQLQDQDFQQQQAGQDQEPQVPDFEQQQQQTARALTRLIKASQQQVAESEDEGDEDEGDEFEGDEFEGDGDGDEDDNVEEADLNEEDLDMSIGDDDEGEEEQMVQASVQARLTRAARNKARRA
jgi:hypothetical protein